MPRFFYSFAGNLPCSGWPEYAEITSIFNEIPEVFDVTRLELEHNVQA